MIQYFCVKCQKVLVGERIRSLVVCPICCKDSRLDMDDFPITGFCDLSLSDGVLMILERSEKEV